jgi:hypothetical protein
MTFLDPVEKNERTMSLVCLLGRRLHEIDASGVPYWIFRFGDGCALGVGGTWRVIAESRVAVAAGDHEQWFGLDEPVDAGERVAKLVGAAEILEARFAEPTGDLRIVFSNGASLEILTDSSGYESWMLWRPDGTGLVGTGGGQVEPFAPRPD